jgi:hypothetical protein
MSDGPAPAPAPANPYRIEGCHTFTHIFTSAMRPNTTTSLSPSQDVMSKLVIEHMTECVYVYAIGPAASHQ